MTRAEIIEDAEMQLPAAMEGATAFEVYVFIHQNDRTIGQIKKVWLNKGIRQIRDAMDKALRRGWPYIPDEELPILPNDGLKREGSGEEPMQVKGKIDHVIEHRHTEAPIELQKRVVDMALQGFTCAQIRAETGLSAERVRKYADGRLKRGRRW